MVWKIACSLAVALWPLGHVIGYGWGSPFPRIVNKADIIGTAMVMLSYVACVIAIVAFVWGH